MANFLGSSLLQGLVDKFKIDTSPVQIQLSGEIILGCHPITAETERWIDRGVDHTNQLTILHTIAPRTLALATSTINGQLIHKELGLDLRPLGVEPNDLDRIGFCNWPLAVREAIAEALYEYLHQLPSTLLNAAYGVYLSSVENAMTADILDSLEKSAADWQNENDNTPPPVREMEKKVEVHLPEDNADDVPGVVTSPMSAISAGR